MTKLLYVLNIVFYACLFLSNDFFLAYNELIYVLIPAALLPIEFADYINIGNARIPRVVISFSNPTQTINFCKSWIFLFAVIFCVILAVTTSVTPSFSFEWLQALVAYTFSTAIFVLVTARLATIPDFFGAFFSTLSLIIALNAAINLYLYFSGLPDLLRFFDIRFSPEFGRVPDHYITSGAMTYATGLVASSGLWSVEKDPFRKTIAIISSILFFACLCLSQSRGSLGGALIATVAIFIINKTGLSRLCSISFAIAGMCSFLLLPKIGASAISRGDNYRFEVWKRFLKLTLERPLFGYGERIQILLEISDGQKLGHAHNIFLSAFMRGGSLALISLLLTYSSAVMHTYIAAQKTNNPIPFGLILNAVIVGLVDFDLIIFMPDWQWVSFWLPVGLSVACEQTNLRNGIRYS